MPTASRIPLVLALALFACTDPQSPEPSIHPDSIPPNLPDGLPAARIEAGQQSSCATTVQGEAFCWGSGISTPVRVADGRRFQDLFGGVCGVTVDWSALCLSATHSSGFDVPDPFMEGWPFRVLRGAASSYCGLLPTGRAYCWGENYNGILGTGDQVRRQVPTPVAGDHRFLSLAMGGVHACAIDNAGALWCWGELHLDGNAYTVEESPVRIDASPPLTQITAGGYHTCGLTADGQAYCWGANFHGQIGDGGERFGRSRPTRVATDLRFTTIAARSHYTCALTHAGAAHCWGSRPLTTSALEHERHDTPHPVPPGNVVLETITLGQSHACGFGVDGDAYCWGYRGRGQLGAGPTIVAEVPQTPSASLDGASVFVRGHAEHGFTCVLERSGAAWCWGANDSGQLGDGSTEDSSVPVRVAGGVNFAELAVAGTGYACGIATDRAAWCWGDNRAGQLGTGDRLPRATPAPVVGGLRFENISATYTLTCALATGGRPYCWGNDENLQPTAAPVPDSIAFIDIAVGSGHACALAADSIAWCWGSAHALLGRGPAAPPNPSALPVAGDQRFIMLTARPAATCGLTADGAAFCWGVVRETKYGKVIADTPTAMGWPPLATLRLGPGFTLPAFTPCGLRMDGTAYCNVPAGYEHVRFRDIDLDNHSCGIRDDGTVLCWGRRDRGQLGDGIDGWVAEPQRVIGFYRGG